MKKTGALASALRGSGATVSVGLQSSSQQTQTADQPSRRDTKAITVHFPEQVRRQLKALAGEQGRYLDDMVAEALNLLFAHYRKPEIAPRKSSK
jgi:hypothetical protein